MIDLALKLLKTNNNKVFNNGDRMNKIAKNLSKFKKLKNIKSENLIYIKVIRFLNFKTKIIFT